MFELAWPWVLILLPLPWLLWYFIPRAPLALPAALKIPFYKALVNLVEQEKYQLSRQTQTSLLFLIWALVLFALSGPRWVGEAQPLVREGYKLCWFRYFR